MQPDLLDLLGHPIVEVGGVQVAVEDARLHWPSGAARVSVLLQGAFEAQAQVELALCSPSVRLTRRVLVDAGEVRRARLDLLLEGGVEAMSLTVKSVAPAAARLRPSWVRRGEPLSAPTAGVLRAALRQALGRRGDPVLPKAPEVVELPVRLEAAGGERPLATEEEALWQPGMPVPERRALHIEVGRPMSLASPADRTGATPECRNCFTRQYPEVIRALQACPTCGHGWEL